MRVANVLGAVSIGGMILTTINRYEICHNYNVRQKLAHDKADSHIIVQYDKWLSSNFVTQMTTKPTDM